MPIPHAYFRHLQVLPASQAGSTCEEDDLPIKPSVATPNSSPEL
uniref:Uncharacterized protein n=1 Tax=Moniliophthora roreri TaxID=221103 RepID=A0A0W0FSW7_MONRR